MNYYNRVSKPNGTAKESNRINNKKKRECQYYRKADNFARAIRRAVKTGRAKKETEKIIGCKIKTFIRNIEKQFSHGMSWNNHGYDGWHLDHVKPIKKFDLSNEKEFNKCFNYKNYQPLWKKENMKKHGK